MSFDAYIVVVAYKLVLMNKELANRESDYSLKVCLTTSVWSNENIHGVIESKRCAVSIARHILDDKALYFHLRSLEAYCRCHGVPLHEEYTSGEGNGIRPDDLRVTSFLAGNFESVCVMAIRGGVQSTSVFTLEAGRLNM